MPYTQDFDALTPDNAGIFSCITTDNITDCWSNDAANTNNWTARSAATGSGGTGPSADHTGGGNYCFLESSSCYSNTSYLLSVDMDVSSLTSPEMRFWYHMYGGDMGSLTVEVSTDGGITWSGSLWNQAGDQGDQWREVTVDLASYAGATSIMARFEGITGTGFGSDMAIDDFSIQEKPLCADPLGLTVSAVSTDSAGVSWTAGGTETAWNLEYGAAGYTQGSGTAAGGLTATNYNINGLSSSTSYDVYVQADCGTDSSIWVGPVTFTTLVSAPDTAQGLSCVSGGNSSVIFSEEFDDNNAGWTGNVGTTNGNWEIPDNATSAATGADAAYSGANYMNYEASSTTTNQGSIVSPAIDLTSAQDDAELSFWMHAYGASMGTLDVGVGTTATGPFTNVFTWSGEYQTAGSDPWINVGVDLSLYVGQTIYIQLTQIDDVNNLSSGYDGDMSIDLFEVSTCVSCSQPTNLSASNITTTGADLLWTPGGSETSWNVVYDISGFNPYANSATIVTVDSLALTSLSANTTYEFYVQADCGGDTSAWSGPFAFNTPCNSVDVFPFIESFEDSSFTRSCWSNIQEVGADDWTYDVGSSGGAITAAYNGTKNARFVSLNGNNSPVTKLVSPVFDLTSLSEPRLSFYYAQEDWASDQNFTRLLYRDSPSALWTELWADSSNVNVWTQVLITLPNASANYQIAFEGINNWGRANVVDEVIIEETPVDLGLFDGSTDISSGCEIDSATISIEIYNYGSTEQSGFDVTYSVNGSGLQVTENVMDTIQPGDTLSYTFNQVLDVSADGLYCIDASTLVPNDLDISNDALDSAFCIENLDCTNILEFGMLEFSLFPNPNNGNFTIVNDGVSELIDLSITDIQGKVVFSKTLNFNKGEQKALSLENIERGIYLIHLNTDNGRKIINMIIQ
jgi:hypothetical protein